jgi:Flp pilus assembly protein TadD
VSRRTRTKVIGLAALGLGGLWLGGCESGEVAGDRASLDFPPAAPVAERVVSPGEFVGAEACTECHLAEYRAWSESTHGEAGGMPGPQVVIAPFDGRPIRFADATVTPRIRAGTYEFVVRQDGFDEAVYRVDGVIGGAHMLGGGTQGFVGRQADGTERFLPWDWSGSNATWFCNTGSRANRGWKPITLEMRLADCGDWPPLRPIGTVSRFANCQECHGSQILTELDPGSGYATSFTTLQVNCESCHGPGREHVARASTGALGADQDVAILSLAYRDKDSSLDVCFQCHALKDVLKEGYLPGEQLETYYALKYPVLGDEPYTVDGRVRSFAYQATHLASACYLQGAMDCVSCHEPHGQGYWDVDKDPLPDPYDDGQCTSCHRSKAVDPQTHTFHEPGSEGAKCVSCHMPYLQHPEVGDDITFARSDHTIAIPRPAFDADLGIRGACAQCHADRTPLELQRQVSAWWGDLKPHRPTVAGLASEFRARNPQEAADLLLHPDQTDPLVQFQGLARLVSAYLRPDVAALPDGVEDRLRALASSTDLDIRSLALAGLHWSRGNAADVRGELVAALEGVAHDPSADEALRGRWVLALGFLGDRARDEGDFAASEIAYRKALEIRPEDARVLHALGQMYNRAGNWPAAVRTIERSLAIDAGQPLAWVNLGIARDNEGDPAGAREAFQEAIRLNPHEALAHFNLGNTLQRADRLAEAAESYARAVAADPGLGLAHFELGRTYIRLERFDEALPHARRAVEFMPDHTSSRQMLADLERALGG